MSSEEIYLSSGTNSSGTGNLVFQSPNMFRYKIPGTSYRVQDNTKVALSYLSLPNSFRNITASLNNNSFTLTYNSVSNVITLLDGAYEVSDINGFLKTQLDSLGWYLVQPSGERWYPVEINANSTLYTITITLKLVPSALTGVFAGFTNPASLTLTGLTPTITIPSTNIQTLLGVPSGVYPTTPQASTQYLNSTSTPSLSNFSIIHLCMRGCNNSSVLNSNPEILLSFAPNKTSGNIMTYEKTILNLIPLSAGTYTEFVFYFISASDNSAIQIIDQYQYLLNLKFITK